jgi:threonine/homoserine/homoserine lactone efflux protein
MTLGFFAKGVIIGFSIAAPVGPIGILCIHKTLTNGRLSGLVSGLGAATADALYSAVAAFGLAAVSRFLISDQYWLRLFGGAFLLFLGIRIFLAKPRQMDPNHGHSGLSSAYFSTFILTLTNPVTIVSYTAIFAGLGVGSIGHGTASAVKVVSGTFVGSSLWWLTLSIGVGFIKNILDENGLRWINRAAGVIIVIIAVLIMSEIRF